jgi:hypothetical protein
VGVYVRDVGPPNAPLQSRNAERGATTKPPRTILRLDFPVARILVGMAVAACLSAAPLRASGQNPPPQATAPGTDVVLVLIPTTAPEGVSLTPLARTFELYSKDSQPLLQRAPITGSPPEMRAQAMEWGRGRGARWVLYATWTGQPGERVLSLWALDAAHPDHTDEVSTMQLPEKLDAAFYREIGLKIRTLLRSAALSQGTQVSAPAATPVPARAALPDAVESPPTRPARFALELATFAETPADFGRATPGIGVSLRFSPAPSASEVTGSWSIGLTASYGFPHGDRTAIAEGDLSSQRLALSVRRRIVSFGGPFEFWGAVEGGAMRTSMHATLYSSGETRTDAAVVPFGTLSLMIGVRPSPRWVVLLGPDTTFFTRRIRGLAKSSEVLTTDYVTLAGVLRLQAAL